MSWVDIKEYTHPVLEDGEAIAFFRNEMDARAFLEWKKKQPNPNENDYTIGEYIDIEADVSVRGS